MFSPFDEACMQRALELAEKARQYNEVPVGAVITQAEVVIGEGYNSPIANHDPSAHAEISAIRQAGQRLANYRLPDSTLYVTLEPCSMCAGAIVHARIQRVVLATAEPRAGAAGSVFNLLDNEHLNHSCRVEFGLMQQESAAMLKAFFRERR